MPVEPLMRRASQSVDRDAYDQALREGRASAVRQLLYCSPPAAAALIAWLTYAESSVVAAQQILSEGGWKWWAGFMPLVLMGIFGLGCGALFGWRMSSECGLVGRPAWLLGLAALTGVALAGLLGTAVLYEHGVPGILWLDSAALIAAGMFGVSFFAYWGQ